MLPVQVLSVAVLTMIILSFSIPTSFGQEGIAATLDRENRTYHTGDSLILSGTVDERKMPVIAVSVFDPEGMILLANNVDVLEDGTFNKTIQLDSPFYDPTGTYTIRLDYGKITSELTFDIVVDESSPPTDGFETEPIPEIDSLVTEKTSYTDNETIKINGVVSTFDSPSVLVGIYDPAGMPAGFYFGEVDADLKFSVSFLAKEGVNFKTEGTYSVQAHYGESTATTYFDFTKKTSSNEGPTDSTSNRSQDKESQSKKTQNTDAVKSKNTDNTKSNLPPKNNLPVKEKELPVKNNIATYDKSISDTEDYDNLSVEDIELGMMLNEMLLNCDESKYADLVSYYNGLGPALIRLCKYNEAIHYFDQTLQQNPADVEALTNKGVALSKLGYHKEAISAFDQALKINPDHILALNNKANVLATIGEHQDAIHIYKTATKIDPQNEVLQSNLATIQYLDNYEPRSHVQSPQEPPSLVREPEPPPPPPKEHADGSRPSLDKVNDIDNDKVGTATVPIDDFKGFLYGLGKQIFSIFTNSS